MDKVDRTLKMRAFTGTVTPSAPKDNLTKEQALALELLGKNSQIEEERKQAVELRKVIEQMRRSLAAEQNKVQALAERADSLGKEVRELSASLAAIAESADQSKAS